MKYEIGSRIRGFREKLGISQKEFAAKIGVSNSRVSNWEQGLNRPDADILALICQILKVSADELLDIQMPDNALTAEERHLVDQFRNKPEVRHAVKILLDIK